MFNLLKMDCYRIRKSRYPRVIAASIVVIILGIMLFMEVLMPAMVETEAEAMAPPDMDTTFEDVGVDEAKVESKVGFSVEPTEEALDAKEDAVPLTEGIFNILQPKGSPIFLLIGIFTVLYLSETYKTGFAKNFVGHYPNRTAIIVAQFLTAWFYTLIMLLLSVVTYAILFLIWRSDGAGFGAFGEGLAGFGVLSLGYGALIGLIFLIFYLSRSQAVTMTFTVLYGLDIIAELISYLEMGIKKAFDMEIPITDQLLSIQFNALDFAAWDRKFLIYMPIMILLTITLSALLFQRSDVD